MAMTHSAFHILVKYVRFHSVLSVKVQSPFQVFGKNAQCKSVQRFASFCVYRESNHPVHLVYILSIQRMWTILLGIFGNGGQCHTACSKGAWLYPKKNFFKSFLHPLKEGHFKKRSVCEQLAQNQPGTSSSNALNGIKIVFAYIESIQNDLSI
jgi:hypothetical protein